MRAVKVMIKGTPVSSHYIASKRKYLRCLLLLRFPIYGLFLVTLCLPFLLNGFIYAHNPGQELGLYLSKTWTTKDGLPQNYIASLQQTDDGYIWIASREGLVRFNGHTFTLINSNQSGKIIVKAITEILADKNTLWIGTNDQGLFRYEKGEFTQIPIEQTGRPIQIRNLLKLKNGTIMMGTKMHGIYLVDDPKDPVARHMVSPPHVPATRIRSLFQDSKGNIWIGTDNAGLVQLKHGQALKGRIEDDNCKVFTMKDGLWGGQVRAIYEDQSNQLWIGTTTGGVSRFVNGVFTHVPIENGPIDFQIRFISGDREGNVWIGTKGLGLIRFKNEHFSYMSEETDLEVDHIETMMQDKEGNLWLGTSTRGLIRLRPSQIRMLSTKNGFLHDKIYPIICDSNGSLYFGTDNGGGVIRMINGVSTRIPTSKECAKAMILSLYLEDNIGTNETDTPEMGLWIGTFGDGLFYTKSQQDKNGNTTYKTKNFRVDDGLAHNFIYCVMGDSYGNIWIGTDGGGLNRYKDGKFSVITTDEGLSHNRVSVLMENDKKDLWVGTYGGGLNRISKNKITVFNKANGLSGNLVTSMYEDCGGTLWISTMDGGISRLKNGRFTVCRKKNGLFDDAIHYIIEDNEGYIWMTSDKGIFKVRKQEIADFCDGRLKGVNCRSYDESDGLLDVSCTSLCQPPGCKSPDGKLWFSTARGVAIIDPLHINENRLPPIVKVERILTDMQPVNMRSIDTDKSNPIRLTAGTRNLEIQYTGLSFTDIEKVKYRYILEGFENHFTNAGKRAVAYYTNLPPGEYQFHVTACNNDGVWNPQETTVHFKMLPYFYQTWWFYPAVGLLLFFLIVGFYGFRVKRMKKRETELNRLVSLRTRELEEANRRAEEEREIAEAANRSKSEFLARMSHEIRTPMNSVIGFTEMLLDSNLDRDQADFVKTISRSGEALINIINDILDFSKIEAGKLTFESVDFDPEVTAFDVCEIILPRIGERPVEILCRIEEQVPGFIKQDPGRFRQVLTNLMSNATKFTEKGEINLTIEVVEDKNNRIKLMATVQDSGIGIHPENLEAVFDVFQQADGSITRKYGGTGLGLPICRQIARAMGGNVWAESEPGKGSTFYFSFWAEKSTKKPEDTQLMGKLEGKRILVVDDNRNNLEILEHILKRYGLEVEKQLGGAGVINNIMKNREENTPIDLCILDIRMPDKSGYEVAQDIRNLKTPEAKMPLLAFSSSTSLRSKKFKDFGFDAFLPKPIQSQKLLIMIDQLLNQTETKKKKEVIRDIEVLNRHSLIESFKHSVHVLLVEDNPVNRKLARFMLTRGGYPMDIVSNGKEAVDVYAAAPDEYDLIFMDIQMPVMDGREATRKIRELGYNDIPIIAMTAETMKGDQKKCLDAGMNDYISKPIRREVVFEMIKKWVIKNPT